MWNISIGVFIAGLFYTFGMFFLGKLFAAISEHGVEHDVEKEIDHDVDHDVEHDVEHDVDHDYDVDHDIDHDVDHDYDADHDYDHHVEHDAEKEIDHHIDHDVEKEIDHVAEKDYDHHVEKDYDHHIDIDSDLDPDGHSGFFEFSRDAPLGVTIGTSLVSFGFIGTLVYLEEVPLPFFSKVLFQFLTVFAIVYSIRYVLGRIFVESGFHITPKHLVGRNVEAVSTIHDNFGEIRTDTEMGLRRFHARPFEKGMTYKRGNELWIISADEKFVYVDHRKDAKKWVQEQSKTQEV
ncbi:MAG: hypothetical protein ACFFDR_12495 [Candidatus Thorarchaeota archaeon]